MTRLHPGIPLLLLACASSTAARAECTLSKDAEDLIARGVALRQSHHDESALALFQRAHADSRCARALAQVALAEKALGRWVDAEAHLREALTARDQSWIEKNRGTLDDELAACAHKLGDLEVTLDGAAIPGATLAVDGREVSALPLPHPVRVVAGTVAVTVRAPGHVPVSRPVAVTAGGLARESIRLTPAPDTSLSTRGEAQQAGRPIAPAPPSTAPPTPRSGDPPPAPRADDPDRPAARRPAVLATGVTLGVTGLALLAAGVATTLVAGSDYDQLTTDCGPAGDTCPPGSLATRDQGKRLELASQVLVPAGAALLVTGVALVAIELRRGARSAVRIVPELTSERVGLVAAGRF